MYVKIEVTIRQKICECEKMYKFLTALLRHIIHNNAKCLDNMKLKHYKLEAVVVASALDGM